MRSNKRPLYTWRFESSLIPCSLNMIWHEWFNDTVAVPNPNSANLLDWWRCQSFDIPREDPCSFTVVDSCLFYYLLGSKYKLPNPKQEMFTYKGITFGRMKKANLFSVPEQEQVSTGSSTGTVPTQTIKAGLQDRLELFFKTRAFVFQRSICSGKNLVWRQGLTKCAGPQGGHIDQPQSYGLLRASSGKLRKG